MVEVVMDYSVHEYAWHSCVFTLPDYLKEHSKDRNTFFSSSMLLLELLVV